MSEEISKEEQSLEYNWRDLVEKKGFVMARAGKRIKNGIQTEESCIVVTVKEKIPLCKLSDKECLPKALSDGTPVDVIESSEISAQ